MFKWSTTSLTSSFNSLDSLLWAPKLRRKWKLPLCYHRLVNGKSVHARWHQCTPCKTKWPNSRMSQTSLSKKVSVWKVEERLWVIKMKRVILRQPGPNRVRCQKDRTNEGHKRKDVTTVNGLSSIQERAEPGIIKLAQVKKEVTNPRNNRGDNTLGPGTLQRKEE